MKQPLEILIKLKLIFASYAELFNGSVAEKVMQSFQFPQKKKSAQTFPHNIYAVLCGRYFSVYYRICITLHNRFMRNPVHPCTFAYFAQCPSQ